MCIYSQPESSILAMVYVAVVGWWKRLVKSRIVFVPEVFTHNEKSFWIDNGSCRTSRFMVLWYFFI
jgi:hypothetical protein